MKDTAYIYKLIDPRDGKAKYIGKTICPKRRFAEHINGRKKTLTPKNTWISKLFSLGLVPEMQIIEVCSEDSWKGREKYWIGFHGPAALKNSTEGGDGYAAQGENNYNSRLVEADIISIYDLYLSGTDVSAIASRYSISDRQTHYILAGKRWSIIYSALPEEKQKGLALELVLRRSNAAKETIKTNRKMNDISKVRKAIGLLTIEKAIAILTTTAMLGTSRKTLAKRFGVNYRTISAVVLGRTWKEAITYCSPFVQRETQAKRRALHKAI